MTVSTTSNRVSYAGDGSTVVFPYTFKIFADADLTVIERDEDGVETTKTLTTDYTVSGAGDDDGGNVTMVTAPASGVTLVILRELDATQETDYTENDAFPAASTEDALDRLTMLHQQQAEKLGRALALAQSSPSSDITVPEPEASKLLGWNAAGDDLYNWNAVDAGTTVATDYAKTLLDDETASAALTTLGVSTYAKTILDDATAAAARSTLGLSVPIVHESGGLEADVSAYNGIPFISGGATTALTQGTWYPGNLIKNGFFSSWSAGTSAAPDKWVLQSSGSVARESGAGNVQYGAYSAKLTSDADGNRIEQLVMTMSTTQNTKYRGKAISISCMVKASDASTARLSLFDGVDTSPSSYHTGGGAWERLTINHTLNANATTLYLQLKNDGNTKVVYFDGPILVEGAYCPAPSQHPNDEQVKCIDHHNDTSWDTVGLVREYSGITTLAFTGAEAFLNEAFTFPTAFTKLLAVVVGGSTQNGLTAAQMRGFTQRAILASVSGFTVTVRTGDDTNPDAADNVITYWTARGIVG